MTEDRAGLSLTVGWIADRHIDLDSRMISMEVENVRESWPNNSLDIESILCKVSLTIGAEYDEVFDTGIGPSGTRSLARNYFDVINFGIAVVNKDSTEQDQCHLFAEECIHRAKRVIILSVDEKPEQLLVPLRPLQQETSLIEFKQCGPTSRYEMIRRIMTAEAVKADRLIHSPKAQNSGPRSASNYTKRLPTP